MKSPSLVILLAVLTCLSCVTNVPTVSKTTPPQAVTAGGLLTQLQPPDDERVYYQPPSLAERLALHEAATALFQGLESGADVTQLTNDFARAGLHMQILPGNSNVSDPKPKNQSPKTNDEWVILWESGPAWRGAGVYMFRTNTTSDTVLQAPHRFHDRQTGEIALRAGRVSGGRRRSRT